MCWECSEGPTEDYNEFTDSQVSSESPNAAGALLMIAGFMTLIQGFILMAYVPALELGSGYMTCCGVLEILFGLGAIAGGHMATKRENFTLVMVGCLLAIAGLGFIVGSILGLVALLMLLGHKDEFV